MAEHLVYVDLILKVFTLISVGSGLIILAIKLGRVSMKLEMGINQHTTDIAEIKSSLKTIGDVVVSVAEQKIRLDAHETRISLLDSRYEELRHGEGMVFPLEQNLRRIP